VTHFTGMDEFTPERMEEALACASVVLVHPKAESWAKQMVLKCQVADRIRVVTDHRVSEAYVYFLDERQAAGLGREGRLLT
jgi:hypothetical protein